MLISLIRYLYLYIYIYIYIYMYIYIYIYWHEIYGTYMLAIYVCMEIDMKYNS